MNHVYREALVPYSREQMFELVHHVHDYSKFLPWCKSVIVKEETSDSLIATLLLLAKGGIHKSFTTKNTFYYPERIEINLVEGPFKHLAGHWRFESNPEGCLVSVDLEFEFSSRLLEMLFSPVFYEVTHLLVQSFTEEAERRYGKPSC